MDTAATECTPATDIDTVISEHAQELSEKLQAHRLELFPPAAEKTLRAFQVSEAAKFLGVKSGYLRNLSLEGKGPQPLVTPSGRGRTRPNSCKIFVDTWTKRDDLASATCPGDETRSSYRSSR